MSRYEGLPADQLRRATRDAFDNLIEAAIREAVDFLIIAGDLFDGDWKDMSTGLYFARAMGRLNEADIRVFILKGNHDAESLVTKSLPWPNNVAVFSSRKPETVDLPELGVALHGQSFATGAVLEDLSANYCRHRYAGRHKAQRHIQSSVEQRRLPSSRTEARALGSLPLRRTGRIRMLLAQSAMAIRTDPVAGSHHWVCETG